MSMEEVQPRESMEFDVVVVGAGPAGLASAIRLKQLNADLTIVVVEKGSEVGARPISRLFHRERSVFWPVRSVAIVARNYPATSVT